MAVAGGQLNEALFAIRETINQHSANAKWIATRLLRKLGLAWDKALSDVNVAMGNAPIYATWDLSIDTTNTEYLLPANCAALVRVAILDSNGKVVALVGSYPLEHIHGENFAIDPPFIKFLEAWDTSQTLRVHYIPRAAEFLHAALVASDDDEAALVTSTALGLKTTPNLGTFDPRPNAYIGNWVRVYTGPVSGGGEHWAWEERRISSYDVTTATITVSKAWSVLSATPSDDLEYEILPMLDPQIMELAVLECSRHILGLEKQPRAEAALDKEYQLCLRSVRRYYQNINRVRSKAATHPLDMPRSRITQVTRPRTVTEV